MRFRSGLCSITLRKLPVDEVIAVAARAGLGCIEWGGDVHVRPGDLAEARKVAQLTADAGLSVASYGSYFRAGVTPDVEYADVLSSAVALGAPRIRIWAGRLGSAEADAAARGAVVGAIQSAADQAAEQGVALGLEFHRNTLTDDIDSTLALLDEIDRDNVSSYWQPPNGMPEDEALETLHRLGSVPAVHVFSWWPGTTRLPLAERESLWRSALQGLGAQRSPVDLLLEFVAEDDPENLVRDGAQLNRWIAELETNSDRA